MPKKPTKGALPRKPRAIPPHIKAAADRAAARAEGKTPKAEKKPAKPIDPVIVPAKELVKMGRPTKYDPKFCKVVEAMCKLGATDADLADALEVEIRTIQRWRVTYEDFCRASEIGKAEADDHVERSLYHRAVGYTHDAVKIMTVSGEVRHEEYREHVPPDTAAAIYWLNNRRGEKWRQVSRTEHTGKDGGAIEIENKGDIAKARLVAFALGKALMQQRTLEAIAVPEDVNAR